MLNVQEYRSSMECMSANLEDLGFLFDLVQLLIKILEYEEKLNDPEFWNDNEIAQKVLQENKGIKETVEEYDLLKE